MSNDQSALPYWLWYGGVGSIATALAGALALIITLAVGWNDPRPTRPFDWEAPGLPLRLEAPSNDTAVTLLDYSNSDFTLEMEATPTSGPDFNGYGLVYHAQDETHYTVFAAGSDGYYAVLRVAGNVETSLVDWQQFPHVHRGEQGNRLRATCAGPTCHFYVNDEYATSIGDDIGATGTVGLWARSFGDDEVTVEFVNIRAWTE